MIKRVTLFLALFIGAMQLQAQTPAFDELRSRFDDGLVFKAAFTHTFYDDYTGDSETTSGNIWIDKVGYKVDAENQLLVVDGTLSTVYESGRNRVIISEYSADEDDFAPSQLLSGIDETYSENEEKLDNGNTRITLVTDDDFAAYLKVEIELNSKRIPVKITAYDFGDNINTTRFNKGIFVQRSEDLFVVDYPDDAEIVDMRY
jgi:outer membrane lipoprotein-sorting protein